MPIKKKLDPAILIISVVLLGSIFIFGASEGTNKAMLNNKVMTFTNGSGFTATTLEIVDSTSGSISEKEYIQATTRLMINGAVIDTALKGATTGIGDDPYTHYNSIFLGSVVAFSYPPDPATTGWLLCDGTLPDQGVYGTLGDALGTAWGATGTLPDLRGRYVFGTAADTDISVTNWRTVDPNGGTETATSSGINVTGAHTHPITATGDSNSGTSTLVSGGGHSHSASVGSSGSNTYYFRRNGNNSLLRSGGTAADASHTQGFAVLGPTTTSAADEGNYTNNSRHTHSVNEQGITGLVATPSNPDPNTEVRPLNAAVYFCIYSGVDSSGVALAP
ncbi:tail fiber protein [bacterium]|nr:tail fiber protein [bacterium]